MVQRIARLTVVWLAAVDGLNIPQPFRRKLTARTMVEREDFVIETEGPEMNETEETGSFDVGTLSARRRVANQRAAPPPELLSEQWKEDESEPVDSSGLIAALSGLALAIGFIAIAGQVPFGNDVASFSYDRGNLDLLTPEQIRARYASVVVEDT